MKLFLTLVLIGFIKSSIADLLGILLPSSDPSINPLESLIEALSTNIFTDEIFKNFVQSIAKLEVLGCSDVVSNEDIEEKCTSKDGLNGAIVSAEIYIIFYFTNIYFS